MTAEPLLPALVTGASRGLGAALAVELSKTRHVVLVGRTVGALEQIDDLIKDVGGEATIAPLNITQDAPMQHLCRSIYDRWGGLSIWAHTAVHAAPLSPVANMATKDFVRSVDTNVSATARLISYVAPLLGTTGTALFFDDPRAGQPYFGAYGTTKAAQIALARSYQAETAQIGPKVIITEPTPMPTATRGRFHPGEDRSVLTQPKDEATRILKDLL